MNNREPSVERVLPLIEAACLGTISNRQKVDLQDLLRGDAELQRVYLEYCRMHSELRCLCRASTTNHAVMERIAAETESGSIEHKIYVDRERPTASFPASIFGLLGGAYQEHHVVFSYMVAVVLLSVAAIVGSLVYVSPGEHSKSFVSGGSTPGASPEQIKFEYVGKITGMKDCVWARDSIGTLIGASVPFDRKYALSGGLLEITYTSGARVILEGPCEYTVDSPAGGYLKQGKLVARVETKVASGQWLVARNKGRNSGSPAPSPRPPASLFSVTTPTAVVTDLGTEFGVEVSENGDTLSHVFQGAVRVDVIAGKAMENVVLHKDESARIVSNKNAVRILRNEVGTTPKFVRQLTKPLRKLDLLDIVAGGDGLGSRRERGIDPTTGMEDTFFFSVPRGGHRQYRPVGWHPMVDGVFIPDGQEGAVQVDSTGGVFDGFPHTAGETSCTIWARAADVEKQHQAYADIRHKWVYHILRTEQYMPEGLGLLAMHSNAGITFDLEAIRRAHKGVALSRFHAVAALAARPPPPGGWGVVMKLDVWVLVDGELKFKRVKLRIEDGPVDVNVELGPNDHFLTLAITDHDRDRRADGGIFGDPVLELTTSDK